MSALGQKRTFVLPEAAAHMLDLPQRQSQTQQDRAAGVEKSRVVGKRRLLVFDSDLCKT
jgi:hypothetical protein